MSIKLSNIYHTYSKGTPFERLALNDVSLEISKGEIVAIIGHTGSGKSTLVQHLNGLLKPDKGRASIDDIDITAKSAEAKTARQQVGMVFQYPEHQLFAETVFEDIAFGPRNKGYAEDEVEKQVREAMAFVGLDYDTFALSLSAEWRPDAPCSYCRRSCDEPGLSGFGRAFRRPGPAQP